MNIGLSNNIKKRLIIFRFFLYIIKKLTNKNKYNFAIYSNDYIGKNLIFKNYYEEEYLFLFKKFLDINKIRVNTFIDIGANIGNHSVFFSDICKNIHSFEPSSKAFELLRINTRFKNIKIHKLGLSDVNGRALLRESMFNLGGSNIIKSTKKKNFFTENIKINRLDNLRFLKLEKIDLIKIDTEGHELKVLKGSIKIIKKNLPIILLEQNISDIENGKSKSLLFLERYGYTFYELDAELYSAQTNILNKLLKIVRHLCISKKAKFKMIFATKLINKDYRLIMAINKNNKKYNSIHD